jgi:hypothetical protein
MVEMTGSERDDAKTDDESVGVFGDLLSFYGSEVVSHGGLAVGFVIALLTLFQARSSLLWLFEPLLFILVTGGVYVVLRIVWYGSLSGIVTNSSVSQYAKFVRDHAHNEWLPHAKASNFVDAQLREGIRLYRSQKWRILYSVIWVRLAISASAGLLAVLMTSSLSP